MGPGGGMIVDIFHINNEELMDSNERGEGGSKKQKNVDWGRRTKKTKMQKRTKEEQKKKSERRRRRRRRRRRKETESRGA